MIQSFNSHFISVKVKLRLKREYSKDACTPGTDAFKALEKELCDNVRCMNTIHV